MNRVEHYYLAGSSRPIEHAELGLQAYHTPSLPCQQPEQSRSFNNCAASPATLLNLINEGPFIACDMTNHCNHSSCVRALKILGHCAQFGIGTWLGSWCPIENQQS